MVHAPLPTPCYNISWVHYVEFMCRQPQLLWVREYKSPVISRRHSFSVLLNLWFFSCLLLQWSLSFGEGVYDIDIVFVGWAELSMFSCSLYFHKLWVSAKPPPTTSLWRSENYTNVQLEKYKVREHFDIMSIYKIIVVGSLLEPVSSQSFGSWQDLQYWTCLSSHEVGLKSNEKAVVTVQTLVLLLHP